LRFDYVGSGAHYKEIRTPVNRYLKKHHLYTLATHLPHCAL
jgi:hypothetical protein